MMIHTNSHDNSNFNFSLRQGTVMKIVTDNLMKRLVSNAKRSQKWRFNFMRRFRQSPTRVAQFWLIPQAYRTINNNPRVKRHLGGSANERRTGERGTRRTVNARIPWSIDPSIFTCGLAFWEESRTGSLRPLSLRR